MTDRNKFEQMLEALINEETEKAKEIFHDIVVEKSRDIYESLLEDDFAAEPAEEPAMETFGDDEGEESEEEPADDEAGDMDMDMGDEEGADGEEMDDSEQTDRILDLEDALEELKAEFEQLMAGEEGEDHMGGMDDMGGDATDSMMGDVGMDEPMDEFAFEGDDAEEESQLNEYVNQVGGKQYNQFGKMGDNGVNTKSIVAGKNDMGGTSANIAKSFSTEKGGTQGGLLNPSTKEENFGNVNVPGGNAGKTAFKKKEPGHGAEKKGAAPGGPAGAGTGQFSRDGEKFTTSMINGAPKRAK
jgi:hypothetical protein